MNNINTSNNSLQDQFKNFSLENSADKILSLLPPIFTDLYYNNEINQSLLDPILENLQAVLNSFQFDLGRNQCPKCGNVSDLSLFKKKNINKRKILIAGENKLEIKVINYYCSVCKHQNKDHHNLTLKNGIYDRHIVLKAVRYYTCGMSYRSVLLNLYDEFQILPSLSTILLWIQKVGILAHEINRTALQDLKGINITWDEFYIAIRDGQIEDEHTSTFSTLFMELTEGAFLYGGVNIGKQTNILIVKSHLNQIKHHEPNNGVADGCLSYPRACAEVFPEMRFINDPVHKARSVRKKKKIKQYIKAKKNKYKDDLKKQHEKQVKQDRKEFQKEIKKLAKQHPGNQNTKRIIQRAKVDWDIEEQNEIEALAELRESETQYFEHRIQRAIYVGQEAAQLAKSKLDENPPLDNSLNSSKVEGWNRVHRSRERKILCYRSILSFYSVIGLLGLLHNMVGVGRGCIYTRLGLEIPNSPWNPFQNFFPIKKTPNELLKYESTPFRHRESKYRQQHGTLLKYPESYRSLTHTELNELNSVEMPIM